MQVGGADRRLARARHLARTLLWPTAALAAAVATFLWSRVAAVDLDLVLALDWAGTPEAFGFLLSKLVAPEAPVLPLRASFGESSLGGFVLTLVLSALTKFLVLLTVALAWFRTRDALRNRNDTLESRTLSPFARELRRHLRIPQATVFLAWFFLFAATALTPAFVLWHRLGSAASFNPGSVVLHALVALQFLAAALALIATLGLLTAIVVARLPAPRSRSQTDPQRRWPARLLLATISVLTLGLLALPWPWATPNPMPFAPVLVAAIALGVGLPIALLSTPTWTLRPIEPTGPRPVKLPEIPGLPLVSIPAGAFLMGSPDDERQRDSDEGPQHEVTLDAFAMSTTTVPRRVFREIMGSIPSEWSKKEPDTWPANDVSWFDAVRFCNALSRLAGLRERYTAPPESVADASTVELVPGSNGFRLPTEAEWEYACRAGTTTPFSFGPTVTTDQVNYDGDFPYGDAPKGVDRGRPVPVGSLPANGFGLHEMHGNVWEWCHDAKRPYTHDAVSNPVGPPIGSARVVRGGCFRNNAWWCRSACRDGRWPGERDGYLGFRVVLPSSPEP